MLLSGEVYTARDTAHRRIFDLLRAGGALPFDLEGSVICYMGPAPARPGQVINSAGPTTSGRMDVFTPLLLERGVRATIGKGPRSGEVREAMMRYGAVYLAAIGGAAAETAACVRRSETVMWEELGPEAVCRLTIERMPLFVVNDTMGGDLYETGTAPYRRGV